MSDSSEKALNLQADEEAAQVAATAARKVATAAWARVVEAAGPAWVEEAEAEAEEAAAAEARARAAEVEVEMWAARARARAAREGA